MADGDRVEREIEDILRKIDDFPSEAARIRARRRREARSVPLTRTFGDRIRRINAPQLLLTGIAIVLISYFVVSNASETAGRIGIIAGLILFFSAFVLSFRTGPRTRPERRWRGRVIDDDDGWSSRRR